MSKTIFEEFFDFFNNLLVGYSKEDTDDNISALLQSESMMEALSLKLSNSMKRFSQTIDQDVIADKNITIDCGSDRLTSWHLTPRGQKYTWYGKEIPNTACIKYGCCYDVSQTSNIELSAINETKVEDHQELFTDISLEMKNKVSATIGESSQQLEVLDSAINEVKDITITNIKKIMENATKATANIEQNIEITSLSPLRCKNQCGEPATAGYIEQSLNIEIINNNIITDFTKSVTETYIKMVSETDTEMSNIDMRKIYIFAIFSCLLITVIYILCFVISYLLFSFVAKRPPPNEIITHIMATILILIVYMFWSVILCIIRAKGKLRTIFCMF